VRGNVHVVRTTREHEDGENDEKWVAKWARRVRHVAGYYSGGVKAIFRAITPFLELKIES